MDRLFRDAVLLLVLLSVCTPSLAQNQLQGFADVNYRVADVDGAEGFILGQLAGHAAFPLTDRLAVFAEVSLTGRPETYTVEAERLMLRYDFSDFLKVSGGRYHTPVSYWNTAFHHGLWLQTSVGRPEYTKFGGAYVPVHFVGLLAEGMFPQVATRPGYFVGVGNGRAGNITRGGDAGDVNDRAAWLAGAFLRPARFYGLQTGVAFYRDRLGPEARITESIYSAYVAWTRESPEVIAEYARVVHDAVGFADANAHSNSYYVQLAYRLPSRSSRFKPYVRFEQIDTPASDPVFAPLNLDYEAAIVGLRVDFAPLAALKFEVRSEKFASDDRAGSAYVQVSFTFPRPEADQPDVMRELSRHEMAEDE